VLLKNTFPYSTRCHHAEVWDKCCQNT